MMGRRIPWATTARASTPAHPKAPACAPKPDPTPAPSSHTSTDTEPAKRKSSSRSPSRLKPTARTPSTSPAPVPPSPPSPLHPGSLHDDGYMMVEDEFASVAAVFTRHLHHKEYQRLKGVAEERKRKLGRQGGLWGVGEGMRKERVKMVEGRNLRVRLEGVLGGEGLGRGRMGDGEEDVEEEEEELWGGTSLAALMRDVSTKRGGGGGGTGMHMGKRSLVGLEPVQSRTRAARGFKRGVDVGESPAGMDESPVRAKRVMRHEQEDEIQVEDLDDFSDDLDLDQSRHTTSRHKLAAGAALSTSISRSKQVGDEPGAHESIQTMSGRKRPLVTDIKSSTSRSPKPDPLSDTASKTPSKTASASLAKWQERKAKKLKEKKMQIHDIPTFLV